MIYRIFMNKKSDFKSVAVLYGGRSAEHEISILTALQAIHAMDPAKYQIIPVYIDPMGKWYTGDALLNKKFYKQTPESFSQVQQVTIIPDPSIKGLIPIHADGSLNLNKTIPIDVYFLSFHGQYGEDGCVQGLLEMADAAYTGCGVLSSATAMDKYHCKIFLKSHGIPVLPAALVSRNDAKNHLSHVRTAILNTLGLEKFPLFVKPSHLGSSVGISRADDSESLNAALANAFKYDDEAIVEPCITELAEINVAVIDGDPAIASVVEMPIASGKALTYEDKYMREGKKTSGSSQGMATLARRINPEDLDSSIKNQVIEYALKSFHLLRCSGVGRFDFILDKGTNNLYFNELNPIPGSLSFYLWQKSKPRLLYTEIVDRLIQKALQRKHEHLSLQKNIGFKALR
jgi:D-alanine-D-alanine ligase